VREEGEVEAVEVVVLDDVGVGGADQGDELAEELGLVGVGVAAGFEGGGQTSVVAHGDEEDAAVGGVEAGGLEVELEAVEVVEGEVAEVVAPGGDEVLLLGSEGEHGSLVELGEALEAAAGAAGVAVEDGGREGAGVGGGDDEAQGAGSVEGAEGDGLGRGVGRLGDERGAEVSEVGERGEDDPGAEAELVADEAGGGAAPDVGEAVGVGPDGDDRGCGVPAEEPLVFGGCSGGRGGHGRRGCVAHDLPTPPGDDLAGRCQKRSRA
jgi:hypothetical protein